MTKIHDYFQYTGMIKLKIENGRFKKVIYKSLSMQNLKPEDLGSIVVSCERTVSRLKLQNEKSPFILPLYYDELRQE